MTFQKVADAQFLRGEHEVLRFWQDGHIFEKLRAQNASGEPWSFLDGPITANNPMGVHHAWGRTYKDAFGRFQAMHGRQLRYQNGFDCQGLWVEIEVQKELGLHTTADIDAFGIDRFVNECKKRVLTFAARQTEQSIRLGYWMDWDEPATLRSLAQAVGEEAPLTVTTPRGARVTDSADRIVGRLGNPDWGGSYFTFATDNNETIWAFLKKCFNRGKVYRGHDVMPWSGNAGSAYSQMEVADGRKLTTHRSVFVRFPILRTSDQTPADRPPADRPEYLLVWTTTPWTLTSNVAAAVNPDLEYVRLKANRDGAIYYFAKENLDYKRLEKEFKEGFGRPEWNWPEGTPKLKSLAQIFKEQGGYEVLGTLEGADLVGWRYTGPFDHLPAQQTPGGVPEDRRYTVTPAACHRVIDGGRDAKGTPHVTAGEGTGIVHIAPGCGDIDHRLGEEHALVGLAPLAADGSFVAGFGEFTGLKATDAAVPDLVIKRLKENGFHVADEVYPHVYPFCWRTGDELVFRLVDEWFIDMSWRDEIKEVVKTINWLPASMQGEERELEWLTLMRDWMISKKRYWGLALPIWFDEESGEFEVIGSLAELKERAVEGWDEFEGHSPHRPWIDRVKIKSLTTGKVLSRVADVGNPWLDAGIVGFSTMGYQTDADFWRKWYPADLVLECFPGQFRNWFYSLLALSTMMRHDETDDPREKRPFKTLFGHRLVMDETGRPMHKSDGTAIWFEEAAEQLGVDTLRWMYLAQNPAADLRFGLRHPATPVALDTPEGVISQTKEGVTTCLVTSRPADEVRRQVLIPLWNSYAFFINYARLDGFDPATPAVPYHERTEIDRWVLSNLQTLIETSEAAWSHFDPAEACRVAVAFIDDLSNWYIRRNRRRFWRSRSGGGNQTAGTQGDWDADKLAAYQTLYEVLVTLTKLLAPAMPFLCERMYGNLVRSLDATAPESVHLCRFPQADASLKDITLSERTTVAQQIVRLGHKLREDAGHRVRQPLGELRYAAPDNVAAAVESLAEVIREELNLKQVSRAVNLDSLVHYSYKPNLKTLGPKYGKRLAAIRQELPQLPEQELAPLRRGERVTVSIGGEALDLAPDDVLIATERAAAWVTASEGDVQIALSTTLTPELLREGVARDFIRQVQQLRKDAGLEIEDRIGIAYATDDVDAATAIDEWAATICGETQADVLEHSATLPDGQPVKVGDADVRVQVQKHSGM